MATTSNSYTANGSTVDFAFTFPYQNNSDIKVSVDEVVQSLTTHYTLHNATTIRFGTAPGSGKTVKVYRDTDSSKLAATFYPGSAIRSGDLNDNYTQNLYVTQEAENDSTEALSNSRVLESGAYVSAITKATGAVTTANTASTNASNAVTTANAASSTASTASTNASNAVTTANTASTNATNAVNTANTASSTATTANNTANAADTKADTAISTANSAATNATNAVSTANTASSTATTANNTANTASTNASNAVSTANAASAAVADAVLFTPKADKAAFEATTFSEDGYYDITDTAGITNTYTSFTDGGSVSKSVAAIPSDFQGATGLGLKFSYDHSENKFTFMSYYASDPEERYQSNTRQFSSTVTYTVKVATKNAFHRYNGTGSSNGFTLNGEQAPFLEFIPGVTYKFDQADSSNTNHLLKFYEEADKTTLYSTGVTYNGTPGSAGAYTQIVSSDNLPTILHYQCHQQANEGNLIQCNTAFDRTKNETIDGGNFDSASSLAALTNTYDGGSFD